MSTATTPTAARARSRGHALAGFAQRHWPPALIAAVVVIDQATKWIAAEPRVTSSTRARARSGPRRSGTPPEPDPRGAHQRGRRGRARVRRRARVPPARDARARDRVARRGEDQQQPRPARTLVCGRPARPSARSGRSARARQFQPRGLQRHDWGDRTCDRRRRTLGCRNPGNRGDADASSRDRPSGRLRADRWWARARRRRLRPTVDGGHAARSARRPAHPGRSARAPHRAVLDDHPRISSRRDQHPARAERVRRRELGRLRNVPRRADRRSRSGRRSRPAEPSHAAPRPRRHKGGASTARGRNLRAARRGHAARRN